MPVRVSALIAVCVVLVTVACAVYFSAPTEPVAASTGVVARPALPARNAPAAQRPSPPGSSVEQQVRARVLQAVKQALMSPRVETAGKNFDVEALSATLRDPGLSLAARRQAAWQLARHGDDDALATLEEAYEDAPPDLKAAIAEGLGHSANPHARGLLENLFASTTDEVALRGAVRGIAAFGDAAAAETLEDTLYTASSGSVRGEAARALGSIDGMEAYDALVAAYGGVAEDDEDLRRDVLAGLGQRDIAETGEFFAGILDDTTSSDALRADVVESLDEARGDVSPVLLRSLSDRSPEVRAEAAWSLASLDEPPRVAGQLTDALQAEQDPLVRTRLYQALEEQERVDLGTVAPLVFHEADTEAWVAAANFYATQLSSSEQEGAARDFEHHLVPQLSDMALSQEDYGLRLGAVIALKKSGTDSAAEALHSIANQSTDERIARAAGARK